jgi:GR25 family glycosyltransferase involved in LPS biosynthesis
MNPAPVVLFVYNRPEHTRKTLEALASNVLADKSELFIYSDGPKENSDEQTLENIREVRKVIREKKWCGEVRITESDTNIGLDPSIISGVTGILKKFEKIIVLEDDLMVSETFLVFMNRALELYRVDKKVMHISGHSFPLFKKESGIYFLKYISPWGWATWADRWIHFENDNEKLYLELVNRGVDWKDFNSGYGDEFRAQLISNVNKIRDTWDIKWHSSVYLNNGLALFPKASLVKNLGFDSTGTHTNVIGSFLAGQIIAKKNDFSYIKPVFDRNAYLRFHSFYLKNVKYPSLIKKFTKYLKWATLINLSGSGIIKK